MRVCKADPPNQDKPTGGINYNKPCVFVMGSYDGQFRQSCKYCGRWMTEEDLKPFYASTKLGVIDDEKPIQGNES